MGMRFGGDEMSLVLWSGDRWALKWTGIQEYYSRIGAKTRSLEHEEIGMTVEVQ